MDSNSLTVKTAYKAALKLKWTGEGEMSEATMSARTCNSWAIMILFVMIQLGMNAL